MLGEIVFSPTARDLKDLWLLAIQYGRTYGLLSLPLACGGGHLPCPGRGVGAAVGFQRQAAPRAATDAPNSGARGSPTRVAAPTLNSGEPDLSYGGRASETVGITERPLLQLLVWWQHGFESNEPGVTTASPGACGSGDMGATS